METITEKMLKMINGAPHLVSIILVLLNGAYKLYIAFRFAYGTENYIWLILNGCFLVLFAFLIFFFGLIPTIILAAFLSLDFILFLFGLYPNITLLKFLLVTTLWVAVYDQWKRKRSNAKEKKKSVRNK